MLERHYVTAITIAGGVVTAGTIAANVGIALIPGVAAGKEAEQGGGQGGRKGSGEDGRQQGSRQPPPPSLPPRGPRRALRRPAQNERCSCSQPVMSSSSSRSRPSLLSQSPRSTACRSTRSRRTRSSTACRTDGSASSRSPQWRQIWLTSRHPVAGVGQTIASGRDDWSHWANTLADTLPGGAAQDLVRTVQTGQLETVRSVAERQAAERDRVRRRCARRRRDPVPLRW